MGAALRELEQAQSELTRREQQRPRTLTALDRSALLALGNDLEAVWFAPTTTPRDQKELLRTLLEEVIIAVYRDEYRAHLTLLARWDADRVRRQLTALSPCKHLHR